MNVKMKMQFALEIALTIHCLHTINSPKNSLLKSVLYLLFFLPHKNFPYSRIKKLYFILYLAPYVSRKSVPIKIPHTFIITLLK